MGNRGRLSKGGPIDLTLELYDQRPIEMASFTFGVRRVDIAPSGVKFDEWLNAFVYAISTEESSPFWVGDLWRYARGRDEWEARVAEALDAMGRSLSLKRLDNLAAISAGVEGDEARRFAQSITHADAVAALPAPEQRQWLEKSKDEGWGSRDLRLNIKAARRARTIDAQAVLEGVYRVVYADPPWLYGDRQPSGSGVEDHFPPMTMDAIAALPIAAHAWPNALLACWIPAPLIFDNPGPRDVIEAWGFTYKAQIIWDKVRGGGGYYTGGNHEILALCTRGSCLPDVPEGLPDSVQVHEKSRVYSEKPEVFRRILEKHWTRGPYLELFGRKPVDGWQVFGNDARLWGAAPQIEGER